MDELKTRWLTMGVPRHTEHLKGNIIITRNYNEQTNSSGHRLKACRTTLHNFWFTRFFKKVTAKERPLMERHRPLTSLC